MKVAQTVRSLLKSFLGGALAVVLVLVGWFWLPATVRYHVVERYSFRASETDSRIVLGIMLPKTGSYQRVEGLAISWVGTRSSAEEPEVDVLKLSSDVSRGETRVAEISYDVLLWQGRARWEGPVKEWQVRPQKDIESDAPVLVEKATELTRGESRADAYRIYDFASSRLSWPKGSRTGTGEVRQSALRAYETGEGVCGEFANLTVALCRAAKVPSKSISGLYLPPLPPFWSSKRTWGHPAGAHAWVEFHTQDGWEMADPSFASMIPWKSLSFGRNDACRLSYGEVGQHERVYNGMKGWSSTQGKLIGAMSSPNKFVAAATASGVSVTPEVTIRMGYADWRWIALAAFVGLSLVGRVAKQIIAKRRGMGRNEPG
jgi:hypothetical protein